MLEVQNQMEPKEMKLPLTAQGLQKNVTFTGAVLASGFPVFTLQKHFIDRHGIEGILGKISWTYMLNATYNTEVRYVAKCYSGNRGSS